MSTVQPTEGLARYVTDWSPSPVTTLDDMSPIHCDRLAATLDLDERFAAGDTLPLLWHWIYFPSWLPSRELGVDGHPLSGRFMPPIPHRRRMFAGGRLTVRAPFVIGRPTVRRAELVSTNVKRGRAGEMLFVTVRHTFTQAEQVVLEEERDLVYRSDPGTAVAFERASSTPPEQTREWHTDHKPESTVLFRFSALTANTHRIHYDERYSTETEGFPALVVHGPLLAIYMAQLLRQHGVEQAVETFDFRLRRPVFLGDPIAAQGDRDGQRAELAVVSGDGATHATASATLR